MSTFREKGVNEIAHKYPVTVPLLQMLYENPLAMFEGASGAPRMAIKTASGSAGAGNLDFVGIGGYQGALAHFVFDGGTVTARLSDDGVTFGAASVLASVISGGIAAVSTFYVDFETGNFRVVTMDTNNSTDLKTGTMAGGGPDVSAIRFTGANAKVLLTLNGGEAAS